MLIESERNDHILEHDEEEHTYRLDGKNLVGVTTIIGRGYPASPQIIDWKIKEGARYVADCLLGEPKSDEIIQQLIKESPKAYKIKLDEAADIGTLVHDYCYKHDKKEESIKSLLFDIEQHKDRKIIETAIVQFHAWRDMLVDDEIIMLEELVCSIKYGYAGRFDRLSNRRGVITLTDYKTSSGFYITQFIQMAAYCIAIEEWLDIVVEDIEIVRFDKKTGKLSTRNLTQVAGTWGFEPKTAMQRLKGIFTSILAVNEFKQKFDKYIRK